MHPLRPTAIIAISSVAFIGAASHAQVSGDADVEEVRFKSERSPGVFFSTPTGVVHQFKTDVDGGGRFDVTTVAIGLGARTELPMELDLSLSLSYIFDQYDFRGETLGVDEPWSDIHTINFGAIVSGSIDTDWTVFGGPVFQFSRESGADWGDSFIGGAVIGTSVRLSDELTLGGGFGVTNEIEDSTRFFPVIVVDWQVNDRLKLTSRSLGSATGDTGLELVYDLAPKWEAGLGAAYRFRRFRLDEDGPTPDGVGQDRHFPIWGRLTWSPSAQLSFSLVAGAAVGGTLELDDSNGNRLARENYDATPSLGFSARLRF